MGMQERIKEYLLYTDLHIGNPQIILQGNREAVIEGCESIIDYDDESIILQAKAMKIKVYGQNLALKCLTPENIVITGKFERIEYL